MHRCNLGRTGFCMTPKTVLALCMSFHASPNGTTQAVLESFTTDGFSRIVAHAVAAATRRSVELSVSLN